MERLTYRVNTGIQDVVLTDGKSVEECLEWKNVLERLAEYEDLEEQGKLLKLPCAVGDTVYAIEVDEENFTHFYCPRKISEYKFNLQMLDLLEMFGKCIFLTREEAEAALKEDERMQEKNETD